MDAEGVPFEGKGIAPDISVEPARRAAREDSVLEKAIEFLSGN